MHTVSGKLNEDAKQFQNDKGTNFVIRIGEKIRVWNKDTQAEETAWNNYSASFFCATEKTKLYDFYASIFSAGSFVVVSTVDGIQAVTYAKNDGSVGVELRMLKAKLVNGFNPHSRPQDSAPRTAQQAPQPVQHKPSLTAAPVDDFDDGLDCIPF